MTELTSVQHKKLSLSNDLLSRVRNALGIPDDISADLEGLNLAYSAWCRRVPFDNIRKMITLYSGSSAPLAGLDAEDFFENWLANGSGGTCWPSSNALFALLLALGFDAGRVAGSMFDLGVMNHGTVKVRIGGQDWMVDTSTLAGLPLPMGRDVFINNDPALGIEVELIDGAHVIWIDFAPLPDYVPCRLHLDPVDSEYYRERYEVFSREQSPFNQRLYFRRCGPDGVWVILGHTRFMRMVNGDLDVREFSRDGLCEYLIEEGVSSQLIDQWIAAGGLDMSFDPMTEGSRPQINGVPPSRRG